MEYTNHIKAVYIVVNAGFAEDIVELTRAEGASGATIINARGTGPVHQEIMGISIDAEKEMVLILADAETAERIMAVVKEKMGSKTPANGFSFMMPVIKATLTSKEPLMPEQQG